MLGKERVKLLDKESGFQAVLDFFHQSMLSIMHCICMKNIKLIISVF